MTSTIFHDKSMLFLVLIVAFFVGASTTNAFMDDAFAGNNGNNGCENANPNAKACENNPNSVKTIKISTIRIVDPVPNASCSLLDIDRSLLANGVTNGAGELLLTVPNDVDEIFQTICIDGIPPAITFGVECNVALTESFTEIVIDFSKGFSSCF